MPETTTRAEAVAALVDAVREVPAGAWDPDVSLGELNAGGWYWSLTYRTGHGNTAAHLAAVRRWDRHAFLVDVLRCVT